MANFTNTDLDTLLAQPTFFGYRPYGSGAPFAKAVFANGASYTQNTEVTTISFDDVGDVQDQVANETATISISSGRVLDPEFIYDITGGLYTKTIIDGTPVVGATQNIASGAWLFDEIVLVENQNGDLTEPSMTSVTGSVDGALVDGTDYNMVFLPNVGWGIAIVDSATVTVEAQDIDLVYDYTPAGSTKLTRGGVKTITPIEIGFEVINDDGTYNQFIFYKCSSDGADGHGFGSENSAEPITMDLTFSAKKDTNRADGDQLNSKEFGVAASLFV